MQSNMLDGLHHDSMRTAVADWRPPTPPELRGRYKRIIVDFETDGVEWWNGARPAGFAVRAPESGQSWYLPCRHLGGPNIDESVLRQWAKAELRDVEIVNINTKFDVHIAREWGVDFEAQGCTFVDVAHFAALLDDHRYQFNQELLVKDFLGDEGGKVKTSHGFHLDPSKFAEYPAGIIAPRALDDVWQVERLYNAMIPRLEAEDLMRVAALESAIIPVVCEMERNGAPLNVPVLERWVAESQRRIEKIVRKIYELTGMRFRPTAAKSWQLLLKLRGQSSPNLEYANLVKIDDPAIQMGLHAKNLESLRSKFLCNYLERVRADGILRYELHQLRSQKDEFSSGAYGTVSGRFSSADVNIQQVQTVERQNEKRTGAFPVRKLFVPQTGVWFCADAKQIEYRLFAHYARNPEILAAYAKDPNTDYHNVVRDLLTFKGPRRQLKILNFSQLYGAGLAKFADMLGIDRTEAEALRGDYFRLMPEVQPLLQRTSDVAMPTHGDRCSYHCRKLHRGYVRTMLGRRARFGERDRHYSALNRIIQGTAADINKMALVALHRERKTLGFTPRFTVHDEVNGDLADPSKLKDMRELLDTQRMDTRVPILWDANIGDSWGAAK